MAFDFPSSPSEGQNFAPAGGPLYTYSGGVWRVTTVEEELVAWEDVTGKPTTFPPTLPIAEADVTNLVADLAAKEPSLPVGGTTSNFLRGDKTWAAPAGGVTDGDKGDIVVSGTGATWLFDPTVVTAAAKTVLDDATVADMKTTLGLGNVDNTSDAGKPVSTAQQTALDLKANISGQIFTGKVSVPASTAGGAGFNIGAGATPSSFADGDLWAVGANLLWRGSGTTYTVVNLNGTQTLTGTKTFSASPVLPTPSAGDNSTKGATTAYVDTADALKANKAGDTFTGAVSLPLGGSAAATNLNWGTAGTGIYGSSTAIVTSISGVGRITVGTTGMSLTGTSFKLATVLSSTTRAGFQVAPGVAPTTPSEGDIWSTTVGGFYGFINGVAKNLSIHVGTTAPSSPITNDLWLDTT